MKGCTIGIDAPGTTADVRHLSHSLGYALTLRTGDVSVAYYAKTRRELGAIVAGIIGDDVIDTLAEAIDWWEQNGYDGAPDSTNPHWYHMARQQLGEILLPGGNAQSQSEHVDAYVAGYL